MKYDRQKGVDVFNTVYCGDVPCPPEGMMKFADFMLETLFGTLWADETLSIRDKRLLLIGVIAAQGEDMPLGIQIRSALKRGELNRAQVEAITVFLTQYVGYPRGSKLHMTAQSVLHEFEAAKNKS